MYKLIRYYNQNREKILKTILIIVFIIGGIQLLNYFAKTNNSDTSEQNIISNKPISYNSEIVSDKSLVSGGSISQTQLKTHADIIKEFIDYCNEKNVNQAYELLTEECKENMFSTVESFYNIYYMGVFNNNKKIYTIENWSGNTYRVDFSGDILSTGNLENNKTRRDYITVVRKDDEYKLNINSYLGKNNSNEVTNYKDIEITVESIDKYMDYEIYNLVIKNSSENTIMLDTSDDTKSVYLLDENNMKYYFYKHEIIENRLIIPNQFTRTIQIKFNNSYTSSRRIKSLVFSKMVLNYDEYMQQENKEDYKFFGYVVNI